MCVIQIYTMACASICDCIGVKRFPFSKAFKISKKLSFLSIMVLDVIKMSVMLRLYQIANRNNISPTVA